MCSPSWTAAESYFDVLHFKPSAPPEATLKHCWVSLNLYSDSFSLSEVSCRSARNNSTGRHLADIFIIWRERELTWSSGSTHPFCKLKSFLQLHRMCCCHLWSTKFSRFLQVQISSSQLLVFQWKHITICVYHVKEKQQNIQMTCRYY